MGKKFNFVKDNYIMETITLKYSEAIKEKLMKFLEKFSKSDLEFIEEEDTEFEKTKAELHKDYLAYKNGETTLMGLEDFEKEMDSVFKEL